MGFDTSALAPLQPQLDKGLGFSIGWVLAVLLLPQRPVLGKDWLQRSSLAVEHPLQQEPAPLRPQLNARLPSYYGPNEQPLDRSLGL